MGLREDFDAFVKSLSDKEREALGGSISLSVVAMVWADEKASIRELIATVVGIAKGATEFGVAFSQGLIEPAGKVADELKAEIHAHLVDVKQSIANMRATGKVDPEASKRIEAIPSSVAALVAPRVAAGKAVLEKMPASIRPAFEDYVAHLLLRAAEASGGFLWWGQKISNDERKVAKEMLTTFGIVVRDPEVRKKFGLD
jgi:hypothetical protein